MEQPDGNSLVNRPGIFMIGSSNVGKRTLLSRLLSVDFEDASDLSSEVLAHGWTINTKYYTADVSVWMAHLHDEFSISSLPIHDSLAALLMVFDLNNLSSLTALRDWVSLTDIKRFDILLCIGNKVDLLPGHSAHAEYRRRLLHKTKDSFSDPYPEDLDYGISETEGCSLLGGDEEPSWEIRKLCLEWCSEHNIEYIEACATNADFDKCLSVDGDSQGVERLYGALSAHMWPGMVLKSGNKITEPFLPENEDLSEEDSEYELDYEILSAGSAEQWGESDEGWVTASGSALITGSVETATHNNDDEIKGSDQEHMPSTSSTAPLGNEIERKEVTKIEEMDSDVETGQDGIHDFEDLEQLMSEISNTRDSLRLMPDFQRREMAAKLAMKMAAMFGGVGDDDDEDRLE